MATIRKEFKLTTSADDAWDALRDFHAVHTRLAAGFVVDSQPDGDNARVVTFANGAVAREVLVGTNDDVRRLAFCIPALPGSTHHSASAEVILDGDGCRFVWITDVLPDELAEFIEPMMEQGVSALKATLEETASV